MSRSLSGGKSNMWMSDHSRRSPSLLPEPSPLRVVRGAAARQHQLAAEAPAHITKSLYHAHRVFEIIEPEICVMIGLSPEYETIQTAFTLSEAGPGSCRSGDRWMA